MTGWSGGFDLVLEAAFALITLAVALVAFRIYRRTGEEQVGQLSAGFLFIAFAYILQSIGDFLADNLLLAASSLQALFLLLGLALILFMTFKTEKKRILWFILIVTTLIVLFMPNAWFFHLIATIYLAFILWHFIRNYRKNPQAKSLLITLAFLLLFIGNAQFLISINISSLIGHLLELAAYTLILANLLLVLRK